jgi:xanthine dehydrogenase accessory factor
MAVSEDGEFQGSLSGGCIEAAVVAEAQATLRDGKPRVQRYGAGSPLIDIRLPCGGAVDLLFTPIDGDASALSVLDGFEDRKPALLNLSMPNGDRLTVHHAPPLRLFIFGHGGTVEALSNLAAPIGAECFVYTPDPSIAARVGPSAVILASRSMPPTLVSDPWTAIAFLFHDHDWEPELMRAALDQPALMIGAMGSLKTHAERLSRMRELGLSEEKLVRIKAPIGLIPSSRDPETLALSILAEAVTAYNASAPTTIGIGEVARPTGVEPVTSRLEVSRSIQLS